MSLFWWPRRSSAYTHFVSKLSAFASISHIFRKRIILLNSPESARRRPALYGAVFWKKRSWRLSTTRTLRLIVWERCFYPRDACSEVSVARSTSTAARQLRWTNVARSTFECAINRHKKVTSELESPPNLFYRETNASADTFNDVLHFFFACPLSLSISASFFATYFWTYSQFTAAGDWNPRFIRILYSLFSCTRSFLHPFPLPLISVFFLLAAAAHTTFKCREKSKRDS